MSGVGQKWVDVSERWVEVVGGEWKVSGGRCRWVKDSGSLVEMGGGESKVGGRRWRWVHGLVLPQEFSHSIIMEVSSMERRYCLLLIKTICILILLLR